MGFFRKNQRFLAPLEMTGLGLLSVGIPAEAARIPGASTPRPPPPGIPLPRARFASPAANVRLL